MERRGRKGFSSARSEEMARAGDRWKKNGGILFDRPKHSAGCSANGRRRRIELGEDSARCFESHSKVSGSVLKTEHM